jgi:endonuclease/exonuclease/phosphatase (EEP) superfamily protein YafD
MMTGDAVPIRFSVCTYNIWTWTRWPERRDALVAFLSSHRPDVFCAQEIQKESAEAVDSAIGATHDRVHDDAAGWTCEGNIWWNRSLFAEVRHGAETVGIFEPDRRLFWVVLKSRQTDQCVFVSTAHWTWPGHTVEQQTEMNSRLPQARATLVALDQLREDGVAQLFMGDLNDNGTSVDVVRNGGFVDCFGALGRFAQATYPARPTAQGPDQTLDWILFRGALRVLTAEVVDFWLDDLAASDHKPVLATFGSDP